MKWNQWVGRAIGGRLSDDDGQVHRFAGTVHHAEGVMPDGEGGVIHWQDTGDGIELTRVDRDEWRALIE